MDVINQIRQALRDDADPIRAQHSSHYFTSEPGDEDEFLGVTVPKQRKIVNQYARQITPEQVEDLLHSVIHEERLCALLIWVFQYKRADAALQSKIYKLYLRNTKWINNWDLVDTSCRDIVGAYIYDKDQSILETLSLSKNIWERRIAMVSTSYFIGQGEYEWTLKLSEQYLNDTHHYIHKATGWMLREVGKRDRDVLISFLEQHASRMPRTALRYAIEHFDAPTRAKFLSAK